MAFSACSRSAKESMEQEPPAPAAESAPAETAPASEPAQEPEAAPAAAETRPAKAPAVKRTERPRAVREPAPQEPVRTAAPRSEPAAAPAPPQPRVAVLTVPSGTPIHVRLQDPLDTGVNQTGDTFRAILDRDIVVDGNTVAARGTIVQGKLSNVVRSGRVEGRAAMALQLTSLIIDGQTYPIQTGILSFEAESTKKKDAAKVGVGAGLGAVIGAIAGGGKGAAIGAAVGAGAGGATVVATRGKELVFDSEHQLSFELTREVTVRKTL